MRLAKHTASRNYTYNIRCTHPFRIANQKIQTCQNIRIVNQMYGIVIHTSEMSYSYSKRINFFFFFLIIFFEIVIHTSEMSYSYSKRIKKSLIIFFFEIIYIYVNAYYTHYTQKDTLQRSNYNKNYV